MNKKTKVMGKGIAIGTGVGILAGAIAGVLLAPKSGKETRADISDYLNEMKDKIAQELAEAKDVTKEDYTKIVAKVVKVYELEKKITKDEAKDIQKKLDDNFKAIKKAIKK